jgi:hypothetical protein
MVTKLLSLVFRRKQTFAILEGIQTSELQMKKRKAFSVTKFSLGTITTESK